MQERAARLFALLDALDTEVKAKCDGDVFGLAETVAELVCEHSEFYAELQREQTLKAESVARAEAAVVRRDAVRFALQTPVFRERFDDESLKIDGDAFLERFAATKNEEELNAVETAALAALSEQLERQQSVLNHVQEFRALQRRREEELAALETKLEQYPLMLEKLNALLVEGFGRPLAKIGDAAERERLNRLAPCLRKFHSVFSFAIAALPPNVKATLALAENGVVVTVCGSTAEFAVHAAVGCAGVELRVIDGQGGSLAAMVGAAAGRDWIEWKGDTVERSRDFIENTLISLEFHIRFMIDMNEIARQGFVGRIPFKGFEAIEPTAFGVGKGRFEVCNANAFGVSEDYSLTTTNENGFLVRFVSRAALESRFGTAERAAKQCFAFSAELRRETIRGTLYIFEGRKPSDSFRVRLAKRGRTLPSRAGLAPSLKVSQPPLEGARPTLDAQIKAAKLRLFSDKITTARKPLSEYLEILLH